MTALVTPERLISSLDWELSEAERQDAKETVEYLSELARAHGRAWELTCPPIVAGTILAAAKRYMRNADGYTVSRAGDETLGWDGIGDKAGAPYFTDRELKVIRMVAGRTGLSSVPVLAWGSRNTLPEGHVPDPDGGKPFPLRAAGDPW